MEDDSIRRGELNEPQTKTEDGDSCNSPLRNEEENVVLRCVNPNCPAQVRGRLRRNCFPVRRSRQTQENLVMPKFDVCALGGVCWDYIGIVDCYPELDDKAQLSDLVQMGGGLSGTAMAAVAAS